MYSSGDFGTFYGIAVREQNVSTPYIHHCEVVELWKFGSMHAMTRPGSR
jgi:hypothetical protein